MARGKRPAEPKGRKITLRMAKNSLKLTFDGKRRLDLSNMEIATFPKCILKLTDVDELDLSRNALKRIPECIERFLNLRWLDLHSNQLEQLPDSIGQLQNLWHLNLCNNRLRACGLPSGLGCLRGLRSLNLGMNLLESLPPFIGVLRELRELGLFDNLLTHTPTCIRNLPHLHKVDVRRNPIRLSDPRRVPDPVGRAACLYLVAEARLCGDCLRKCREARGRLTWRRDEDSLLPLNPTLSGLMMPNSIARADQAPWR